MKLTKSEFKTMIKECIKELITEGAFDTVLEESMHSQRRPQTPAKPTAGEKVKRRPLPGAADPRMAQRLKETAKRIVSDGEDYRYGGFYGASPAASQEPGMMMEDEGMQAPAPGLQRLVESTATTMAKGNQALASQYAAILADTAVHTLPKQMANDPSRSGYAGLTGLGAHTQVEKVHEADLQNLAPAGDMSHWAALAFGTAGRK